MGRERVADAVEAVHSDRMTSRAAAKTCDIFVGLLQKRVSDSVSMADRVDGSGPVRSICDKRF